MILHLTEFANVTQTLLNCGYSWTVDSIPLSSSINGLVWVFLTQTQFVAMRCENAPLLWLHKLSSLPQEVAVVKAIFHVLLMNLLTISRKEKCLDKGTQRTKEVIETYCICPYHHIVYCVFKMLSSISWNTLMDLLVLLLYFRSLGACLSKRLFNVKKYLTLHLSAVWCYSVFFSSYRVQRACSRTATCQQFAYLR